MKTTQTTLTVLALGAAFALAACQAAEGPVERAGKQVDQAAEKVGDQVEKAGEKIEDKAKEIKKDLSN